MIINFLRNSIENFPFIRRCLSLLFGKVRNYSPIFSIFHKFQKIINSNFLRSNNKRKILVAGSVGMNSDNFVQSIIANYYSALGHEVDILLCDGVLKACFNCKFFHFYNDHYQRELINNGPINLCGICNQRGQ